MTTTDNMRRARVLIARCLDGEITEAETGELNRLLVLEPAVADEFVGATSQESALETAFGPQSEEPIATPAPPRRPAGRRFIATGAVIVAAVVLLAVWSAQRSAGPPPAVVAAGDTREASRTLRFADGSNAELRGAETRLEKRSESPASIEVALVAGAARFEVARRADRRFRVWVGAVAVDVVGTIFTVERLASGVRVSVERGSVKVISETRELTVTAGGTTVVALPATASDVTVEAEPVPPTIDSPGKHRPPAGKRDDVGTLLKASSAARHAGRLEEARELLQRIVDHHPRDPRAAYAAFIMGRVLLEELDRPREAAAAFARVKSLDPRTPLEQDALVREVESWSRAGEKQRARERAGEYLSRFPDGPGREQVGRYSRLE